MLALYRSIAWAFRGSLSVYKTLDGVTNFDGARHNGQVLVTPEDITSSLLSCLSRQPLMHCICFVKRSFPKDTEITRTFRQNMWLQPPTVPKRGLMVLS